MSCRRRNRSSKSPSAIFPLAPAATRRPYSLFVLSRARSIGRQRSIRRRFGAAAGQASAGIEIAAEEGAPVHAIHEGVVAFADPFSGFGNLVIVDHGSQTFSLYGDLMEIQAKRGSKGSNEGSQSAASALRRQGRVAYILSFASTVGPSIPYNGCKKP